MEDKDIFEVFIENGIGSYEAREILLFLPIAFVRQLLPDIKWHETYIEYKDNKQSIEKKSMKIRYLILFGK